MVACVLLAMFVACERMSQLDWHKMAEQQGLKIGDTVKAEGRMFVEVRIFRKSGNIRKHRSVHRRDGYSYRGIQFPHLPL